MRIRDWINRNVGLGLLISLHVQQNRLPHAAEQAVLLYFIVWAAALAIRAVPNFQSNGWHITGAVWGGAALAALIPGGKRKRTKRKSKSRRGRAHKEHK